MIVSIICQSLEFCQNQSHEQDRPGRRAMRQRDLTHLSRAATTQCLRDRASTPSSYTPPQIRHSVATSILVRTNLLCIQMLRKAETDVLYGRMNETSGFIMDKGCHYISEFMVWRFECQC